MMAGAVYSLAHNTEAGAVEEEVRDKVFGGAIREYAVRLGIDIAAAAYPATGARSRNTTGRCGLWG